MHEKKIAELQARINWRRDFITQYGDELPLGMIEFNQDCIKDLEIELERLKESVL